MEPQKYIEEFMRSQFKGKALPPSVGERVQLAIDKAYRDMTPRTIKGHTKAIKTASRDFLQQWFEAYFEKKHPQTKEAFDGKYYALCSEFLIRLNSALSKMGLQTQEFGKAQKIINMTFKYLYCLLPEKRKWFTFCHMPLDSYTLNWYFEQSQSKSQNETWSSLTVERYREIEEHINSLVENGVYSGLSPLEAEFIIWSIEKKNAVVKELKTALNRFMNEPALTDQLSEEQRFSMDAFKNCLDCLK